MKKIVTPTLDGGLKLDLQLANLFQKNNIPATFYISLASKEFSLVRDLLSEQEIQSLSKNFENGGHTLHHLNLAQVHVDIVVDNIKAGMAKVCSVLF
jgi:hypothetical protein